MPARTPTTPPPPPPTPPERVPAGYKMRPDLDVALRAYQAQTGAKRNAIIDHALEEYLTERGVWSPEQ